MASLTPIASAPTGLFAGGLGGAISSLLAKFSPASRPAPPPAAPAGERAPAEAPVALRPRVQAPAPPPAAPPASKPARAAASSRLHLAGRRDASAALAGGGVASEPLDFAARLAAAHAQGAAQGAAEERARLAEERARDLQTRLDAAEARAAALEFGRAEPRAASAGASAHVSASSQAARAAPASEATALPPPAPRAETSARQLYLGVLATGRTAPRSLPLPDKVILKSLGETEDATAYSLRLATVRGAIEMVQAIKPSPTAADFVEDIARGKFKQEIARILLRDPVLRGATEGAVKAAATATRVVQIAIVGACMLAGVKMLRSAKSTWADTAGGSAGSPAAKAAKAAKAGAITSALGVTAGATLGDAFATVRGRCGFDPALSAAKALLPSSSPARVDGDSKDEAVEGEGGAAEDEAAKDEAAEDEAAKDEDEGFKKKTKKKKKKTKKKTKKEKAQL